ncbi:MAG: hypothetical protein EBU52_13465 [Cytophagia bacterium]|nr:hypothetical protein [Cytophagia bacterium]
MGQTVNLMLSAEQVRILSSSQKFFETDPINRDKNLLPENVWMEAGKNKSKRPDERFWIAP